MSKKPNATGHGGHSGGGRDIVDTVKILGCIYISIHIISYRLVIEIYNILNIIYYILDIKLWVKKKSEKLNTTGYGGYSGEGRDIVVFHDCITWKKQWHPKT